MARKKYERANRLGADDSGVLIVGAEWATTAARILLGIVCLWFGTNELLQPSLWVGYVPLLPATAGLAVPLVLVHGAVLLVLGVALIVGIAPRVAAGVVALLLLEILLDLLIGHGITDIAVRDLGILGLAVAILGSGRHRLLLER